MHIGLNSEQQAAVEALKGPVLIAAGAGSGKTRTLTERFVAALGGSERDGWVAAALTEVVAITFSDKAAGEIAERVRGTLRAQGRSAEARSVDSARISTIHGLCSRILRHHALEAGIDPGFRVAESIAAQRLRAEAFEAAARRSLLTLEGAGLLAAFEFREAFAAVERLAAEFRSRGLPVEALQPEETRRASHVYERARVYFPEAVRAIDASGEGGRNAATLRDRCEDCSERLSSIDAGSLAPHELAHALWDMLEPWTRGGRAGSAEAVRTEAAREHERLMRDAAACAAAPHARALAALTRDYEVTYGRLKREHGLLDFDDLQMQTLTLLRERPESAERLRDAIRMIMIDEFQDTDALQLAIVAAIDVDDVCTVGDEFQSIYRFRGADLDVYRAHNDAMDRRGARRFELSLNYRSHADVLDFVNTVFSSSALFGDRLIRLRHGRTEPEPPLVPDDEPRVELLVVDANGESAQAAREGESTAVARRFARLRDERGVAPGHMVVLMAESTHARTYARALMREGFDVALSAGGKLLETPEALMMRAFLRAVANPHDDAAFANVLTSEMGGVSDGGLLRLAHARDGAGHTLWDAAKTYRGTPDEQDRSRLERVVDLVERARDRSGSVGVGEIMLRAVEEADVDMLLLSHGRSGQQAFANLLKLAREADAYEAAGGAGVAGFSTHLDALEAFGERVDPAVLASTGTEAVRIMTVHAAKGLEFPVVAVVETGAGRHANRSPIRTRAEDGRVTFAMKAPLHSTRRSAPDASELFRMIHEDDVAMEDEESKRRFYVACTRAREVLILSGAADLEKGPDEGAMTMLGLVRGALGEPMRDSRGGDASLLVDEQGLRLRIETVVARSSEPRDETLVIEGSASERGRPEESETGARDGAAPTTPSPRRPAAPERLSYSDLALYRSCPARFRAERVMRVGRLAVPGDDTAVRFGSAVHAALQLVRESAAPPPERLQALGRTYALDDAGLARMSEAVQAFIGSDVARELAAHDRAFREWAFGVRLGGETGLVDLVGTIDAYGRSGTTGLVVDYKTGMSGETDALEERYETQASCYALVALKHGCERVDVVFSRVEDRVRGDGPREVRFSYSASDAQGIEHRVLATHALMASGEYEPLTRWNPTPCGGCPISGGLCAIVEPVSARGQAHRR